jgi:hypothetical protein
MERPPTSNRQEQDTQMLYLATPLLEGQTDVARIAGAEYYLG